MAKKIFRYRGKTFDEIKNLKLNEFMEIIPARERRSLKRGFTPEEKALVDNLQQGKTEIKTHCRDMVILPIMVGKKLLVYMGNKFEPVIVTEEMLGHRLGEFVLTRKRLKHNAPGIGATKSSGALSVK